MATRAPIGWPLLPVPDAAGQLHFPTSLDVSVRQRIRVILSVRPGELMFHPEFGAGLDELIHQPNTLKLRRDIVERITENLARWEPRIVVDRVDVEDVDGYPTHLRVNIAYHLRRTGRAQQIGLTLDTGT
jgi:phage baseplate assembly protein W